MELKKDTISLCDTIADGSIQAMADGDVIVPDIKPDILKLLQVDADACVTDKYFENGRLIINGRVDYKVLYIPDREKEKLQSITTSMDFRQVVDCGADMGARVIVMPSVERVEFNAVNSRKLRLRAIVKLDYEVCRISETEVCVGIDAEDAECALRRVSFENTVDISEHDFTIKEVLEVPSGQSSIAEIMKTDVRISDTEYKTVTGKVIVKGNVGVCILYTDDEGEIKYIESESPFTEVFDADGVGDDTICDIDYNVIGTMCDIQADNDGDMRVAELDIDVSAAVRGVEPEVRELMSDCYIPYRNTVCRTEKLRLTETVERPTVQNTLREVVDFPGNIPGVRGVYNVMTNAVITKAEQQRNKIICEGRIETYILYLTDSNENPVYSLKKDIPFSYMLDCESSDVKHEINIKAEVKHISYNLNSAGSVELRCLLSIDGKLQRSVDVDNIVSVETAEKTKPSGIVVYFCKDGDMLWDIAKKYAVPQERIRRYNDIEGDRIEKGVKLFIM